MSEICKQYTVCIYIMNDDTYLGEGGATGPLSNGFPDLETHNCYCST